MRGSGINPCRTGKSATVFLRMDVPYRCLAAAVAIALCCANRVLSSCESPLNLGIGGLAAFCFEQLITKLRNAIARSTVMVDMRIVHVFPMTKKSPGMSFLYVAPDYSSPLP
jgi:hypothetical protein